MSAHYWAGLRIEIRLADRRINEKVWRKFEASAHLPTGWKARRAPGRPGVLICDFRGGGWSTTPAIVRTVQQASLDWVDQLETLLLMISQEDK